MKKPEKEIDDLSHNQSRTNNPNATLGKFDEDLPPKKYHVDEWSDPCLVWNSKREHDFEIPTLSIHRREVIHPKRIIDGVKKKPKHTLQSLFETDEERDARIKRALEFYQHDDRWTNRMIAGDSMLVMNSLLEREGMAGSVQMIYFDPPYGIRFGSNFQPFVNQRDVKDRDEDLSIEPETITAFRDTWEKGIHSYLNYIRDRLQLARILLSDSGSIFVQIGDENVHLVRTILDEIFGRQNFVSQIFFTKTGGMGAGLLDNIGDYILWYANDKKSLKYHQLYLTKVLQSEKNNYRSVELPNGERRSMTNEEIANPQLLPIGAKIFCRDNLTSATASGDDFEVEIDGKTYKAPRGTRYKTNRNGMQVLISKNRVVAGKTSLSYIRYFDDFPLISLTNIWNDTKGASDKIYTVQTSRKVIQRCMLMTTDPDDLVLDITCGSGTTAYVAEQFGRRWITCDTSRIAIELAKERLLTAVFDYYKLKDPLAGISKGFEYKTVPHITLKSIANNQPPATETLFDQPIIDAEKVRVTGPFTVESLPAPIIFSVDDVDGRDRTRWQDLMRMQLSATGISGKHDERIRFKRIEELEGLQFFNSIGLTTDNKRAMIFFYSESKSLDARMVTLALKEFHRGRFLTDFLIFAAFQFDAEAEEIINDAMLGETTILRTLINPDLSTGDLRKNQVSAESFIMVGQPDAQIKKLDNGKYIVEVLGFDYFDFGKSKVVSGSTRQIAMWMLDPNYDTGHAFAPMQIFFPMKDSSRGWNLIAKTLRGEIDPSKLEKYFGSESLPFETTSDRVAVKIIDDRGLESMRILRVPR